MLRLAVDARRERFVDLTLNVVLVEFTLALFVLLEHASDILVDALAFHVDRRAHLVVNLLLFVVHLFNLTVTGAQRTKFLDLRSQPVLLVFNFGFDLLNQLVQLLQRFRLGVIELLLQLGDTLDLILDVRVALNALFLLKLLHEGVNIVSALLQDGFGPL